MKVDFRFIFACLFISFQSIASPIQFEDTSTELGFTRGTETWGISWGQPESQISIRTYGTRRIEIFQDFIKIMVPADLMTLP